MPLLIQAANTHDDDDDAEALRKAAILALGRIGSDAKPAIPFLRKMTKEAEASHTCPSC